MKYTICLIYGSVRFERKGIKAANYMRSKLEEMGYLVHFIDPREYQLPFLDKMYKEFPQGSAPEVMEEIAEKLRSSDGFIIVTGEYNHSIPPALKNLLDHFQQEYYFKPSAIVSYSGGYFGGVRAAVQLRAILAELGMSSIPSVLPVPFVQDAFDKDDQPVNDIINRSAKRFLNEFEWYLEALKLQREKGTPH